MDLLSCLNQANNSCHFNNSAYVVSLLILQIIYSILYLKTVTALLQFWKSWWIITIVLTVTLLHFLFFNNSPRRDLCMGNVFFDFVFIYIRRTEINFFTIKYGLDGFGSSRTEILEKLWESIPAILCLFVESLWTRFNCFSDGIKTWAG